MKFAPSICTQVVTRALLFTAPLCLATLLVAASADAEQVQFQKPSSAKSSAASSSSLKFRSATAPAEPAAAPVVQQAAKPAAPVAAGTFQQVAKPLASAPRPAAAQVVRQAPAQNAERPSFTQPAQDSAEPASYRTASRAEDPRVVSIDRREPLFMEPASRREGLVQTSYCVGCNDPACGITEPACGCAEPTCGICEPACGIVEPDCGILEPGCGIVEPGCGIMEPGCGMEPSCACGEPDCGDVACGSGVRIGSDYWCFPVCLPRFRDLSVWGGVHGFKGPRDAPLFGGSGDGNFGFQEGLNLGGKAPLIGLLFPQLSYQLGYQAVQSHLSGTSGGDTDSRLQDFVTAGFFRRTPVGLQFGAVWDYMNDDWISEGNFQQVRYEISLKSQRGREFGFMGSTHTNSSTIISTIGTHEFQAVDQYKLFFRCHIQAAELRFWGGASNDSEGIFGGDCYVPFNDRWSLQTGFNYLIPDAASGVEGAREEAWNVGMNLVWHYGRTAKQARHNRHRPMFATADNGSMFIDQAP